MKKKYANLYVKLTAKSCILFMFLIALSVTFILSIALNTKVDIIHTYNGRMKDNQIIIENISNYEPENVYIYENRNENVFSLKIDDNVSFSKNCFIIHLKKQLNIQSETVKVDIPIKKVTLFERVFLHGGKNE